MNKKLHHSILTLTLAASVIALTPETGAQDEEVGGLPPVLKACDEKGNRDGKIQRQELPERLLRFFESADLNGDGVLTWQEVDEAKAKRFADLPRLEDVIGKLPQDTLDLLGGKLFEVGWSEGKLHDASRRRDIGYLIRYPKDRDGLTPIVLLSHGGFGSAFGQYAFTDLATTYARLGFLAVNIGHRPSANEMQHRYDRPLDVSFLIDALVRTRAAALHIPGGGGEGAMPMPPEFKGIPDVDHIGLIGHSLGAFTAHAVGGANFSPTMGIRNFRDPRVDAIVPISPQGFHRFGSYDEGPTNNSWSEIRIPVYLICGELESPEWRRQPFDRYPAIGDKFFTIGKGYGHNIINGDEKTRRLLALNTALFFHTYLRGGQGRDKIGALAWLDGWTLERKLDNTGFNPAAINKPPVREQPMKTYLIILLCVLAPALATNAQTAAPSSLNLKFTKDYTPGTKDTHGEFMGGTETVRLIGHGGRLFAGIGVWNDAPDGDPRRRTHGAQVLRKDSADAAWVVGLPNHSGMKQPGSIAASCSNLNPR